MSPLAPERLSTTMVWPSRGASFCCMMRMVMSAKLPGGKGTMTRIGLVGQLSCADAVLAARQRASSASARRGMAGLRTANVPPLLWKMDMRNKRSHKDEVTHRTATQSAQGVAVATLPPVGGGGRATQRSCGARGGGTTLAHV